MKKVSVIICVKITTLLLLLSLALLLCSCNEKENYAFEGKKCIKCGADATCYCGVKFDKESYQTIDLYYCDSCKQKEMGQGYTVNGDFTDPNNPNCDAGWR